MIYDIFHLFCVQGFFGGREHLKCSWTISSSVLKSSLTELGGAISEVKLRVSYMQDKQFTFCIIFWAWVNVWKIKNNNLKKILWLNLKNHL